MVATCGSSNAFGIYWTIANAAIICLVCVSNLKCLVVGIIAADIPAPKPIWRKRDPSPTIK